MFEVTLALSLVANLVLLIKLCNSKDEVRNITAQTLSALAACAKEVESLHREHREELVRLLEK
jgi:hypothetical protein